LLLPIGNRRHDIGKRIWSELTHDATYTVVIRNCGMDELFFHLAVCPANHFNGSRGSLKWSVEARPARMETKGGGNVVQRWQGSAIDGRLIVWMRFITALRW
jgi:hypothetical protein